jgi:LacI family transcriptional regulator
LTKLRQSRYGASMAHDPSARRPATVQDVARAAKVSKATAARALGRYGSVSARVLAQVMAAAEALGYRPNELARSMTTGRSGTIGVIVGDIENPYFGLAVRGISDGARARGFNVILANSGEDLAEEKAAVEVLVRKQIDGLIVSPAASGDTDHLRGIIGTGRPVVLMDREIPSLGVDAVVIDDRAAARNATAHLLAAGHRRVHYLTAAKLAEPHFSASSRIDLSTVANRIAGFSEALAEAGIADPTRHILFGAGQRDGAQERVRELLMRVDRPTAILASDSLVALEVFRAMKTVHFRLPDDLSLISFHDADWTSATTPSVTVVAQPAYDLGREVVAMLVERIEGLSEAPRRRELSSRLIERESVAKPSLADDLVAEVPQRR